MRLLGLVIAIVFAAAGVQVVAPSTSAASLAEVRGFGSNPGNLRMFTYVPDGLASGRPLVVALHGCTQSAAAYDEETGWAKWADAYRFAVVLPQQQKSNNPSTCFDFWLPGDQSRDGGEALSIKQMTDWMKSTYGSDASKIFVTGLSAGGAMTNVMLATYPDVFSAGAVVAGVPYKCATTAAQTTACNKGTAGKTPTQWGDLVRGASSWAGPWPRVSVWHGTSDGTVSFVNEQEIMEQWTNVAGVDQTADVSDTVAGYPHAIFKDGSGNARVETYAITGMGHGQPIDPGTGVAQCGIATGYNLDADVCASYHIARWFGIAP